jgi:hypothetical protein
VQISWRAIAGNQNAVSTAIWTNARQPGASTSFLPEVMVLCVDNAAEDPCSPLYERHIAHQHALTFEARWRNPVEQVASAAEAYLRLHVRRSPVARGSR